MSEKVLVACRDLMPAIIDMLERGLRVRLAVTGNSMFPVLRMGCDSVDLVSPPEKYRRGDVVLLLRSNGSYVLHRIVKLHKECFFLAGDAQSKIEGPFRPDQVIALMSGIWRGDRYLPASNRLLCILSNIWIMLLPLRPHLLHPACRVYSFLRRRF